MSTIILLGNIINIRKYNYHLCNHHMCISYGFQRTKSLFSFYFLLIFSRTFYRPKDLRNKSKSWKHGDCKTWFIKNSTSFRNTYRPMNRCRGRRWVTYGSSWRGTVLVTLIEICNGFIGDLHLHLS